MSRLGTHADFFLILLVPLYFLFPSAWTLLILQAIVVGIGAVVIYLLNQKMNGNKLYSLLFGLLFLLNPSVIRSSIYDFHAVVLATTFLLLGWYCLIKKNGWGMIIWCVLAGITKEQVWLITGMMSVYYAWRYKDYTKGISFALVSFFLCFFLISVAIPHANNAPHFALEYYSDYGSGTSGILKGVFTHPGQILQTITDQERRDFLWQLFSPLSIFPLAAPFFLMFMSPELFAYLVSNNHNMHVLYYQYTATVTPFIFIAAIYGFSFVWKYLKRLQINHIFVIPFFILGFFFAYRYSPFPLSREPQTDMFASFSSDNREMHAFLKTIPNSATVSASNNLGAHLANREHLYIFPLGYDISDYVLVDKSKEDMGNPDIEKATLSPYLQKSFENSTYVIYRRKSL
jgi:uncharacterized membrane protein